MPFSRRDRFPRRSISALHARSIRALAPMCVLAATAASLSACSLAAAGDGSEVAVVVGYQSKTINTATAGNILRDKGFLQGRLDELGRKNGKKYRITWQDYDTGAPITTNMLAGKIDIGSMGDYPLLINSARAQASERTETKLLSITGSNRRGGLNSIVVKPDSPISQVSDLRGKNVSTSVGSAGHGLLVQALRQAGLSNTDLTVANQQPPIGASALESGKVDAFAQFVAWPGLLVFGGKGRLIYDGANINNPTLHGVVARKAFLDSNPDVGQAFLLAQLDATKFIQAEPMAAAQLVARTSGLPPEVVYLYNGPGGTDFTPALRPELVRALRADTAFLKSIGQFDREPDVERFVDTAPVKNAYAAFGWNYTADESKAGGASAIRGVDPVCKRPVEDSAKAGEIWVDGENTQVAVNPTCLLKAVAGLGKRPRAVYATDAVNGTRWFADHMIWLRTGTEFTPFTTTQTADQFAAEHPGATRVSYADAVAAQR